MEISEDAAHRPWPLPRDPWILRQAWNTLLFAHWPVARDTLRDLVPRFLELDLFDNNAWLTIAPFRLTDLSPRGVPALPFVSAFNEINVRTYVAYDGIPGVYFFSLDANSAVAVGGASTLFHLPYYLAEIEMTEERGAFTYHSRRRGGATAEFQSRYTPAGPVFEPQPRTLDYFLTERYCLYAKDSQERGYRVEVHHRPWQLQAAEVEISLNSMAEAAGLRLPSMAPTFHFARRQDVLTWAPHRLR